MTSYFARHLPVTYVMDHERSTSGDILESAIETRARVGEAINSSLRVLNRSDISLRMVFGHFTFLKLSVEPKGGGFRFCFFHGTAVMWSVRQALAERRQLLYLPVVQALLHGRFRILASFSLPRVWRL